MIEHWRRRWALALALVIVIVTVFLLATSGHGGPAYDDSHDGRLHTCGLVTDDGVTEHLADYRQRCGEQ